MPAPARFPQRDRFRQCSAATRLVAEKFFVKRLALVTG
jgi:hypothetical protein